MNVLEITASPTEIRINRGYSPVETYRLDGTVTDFGNVLCQLPLPYDGLQWQVPFSASATPDTTRGGRMTGGMADRGGAEVVME